MHPPRSKAEVPRRHPPEVSKSNAMTANDTAGLYRRGGSLRAVDRGRVGDPPQSFRGTLSTGRHVACRTHAHRAVTHATIIRPSVVALGAGDRRHAEGACRGATLG